MPKWIRNLINKNKALEILVENYNVRTIVFSLLSVLVAIGLTVFNIVMQSHNRFGAEQWHFIILCL